MNSRLIVLLLIFFVVTQQNSYSQSAPSVSEEIFVSVEPGVSPLTISVYNLETGTDVTLINDTATSSDEWKVSADDEDPPGEDGKIPEKTRLKITIEEDDGTEHEYLYYYCPDRDGPVGDEFFCRLHGAGGRNDIRFNFDGQDLTLEPNGALNQAEPDVHANFVDDYWFLPIDHQTYCGSDTSCKNELLGYFITPWRGSTTVFETTDEADITVPSSHHWEWDGNITLEFPSSRQLVVEGTLEVDDMILTANGSSWSGVEFKSGSEATFTNVDILKVGSGAHTGTLTVRNGADVTLVGDNIILGPNFKAESGSTFLATPDAPTSEAPEIKYPDLEIIEKGFTDSKQYQTDPQSLIKSSVYPNPFNPQTTIRYHLPTDSDLSLKVYNILGQEVKELVSEFQRAGEWEFTWDGRDRSGSVVPSGTYIYRIETEGETVTGRLVFVK